MELWIRSQNKEVLVKCKCLALEEQTGGKYLILNYSGLEFYQYLGTYDYERALEVLDEIMQLLKSEEILHIRKSSLNNLDEMEEPKYILQPVGQPKIYEMPKE